MTRLNRYALILITIFAGSIGVIWRVGHSQPFPVMALFTNPDLSPCTPPCLFGIRPGQTSYADAITLLRAHPFTRGLTSNLEGDVFHDETMSVVLNHDSTSVISTIQLTVHAHLPSHLEQVSPDQVISVLGALSLGQVINALGAANLVAYDPTLTQSYYNMDRLVFMHQQAKPGQLDADDAFESLTMYATLPDPPADGLSWRGLGSLAYLTMPMP